MAVSATARHGPARVRPTRARPSRLPSGPVRPAALAGGASLSRAIFEEDLDSAPQPTERAIGADK